MKILLEEKVLGTQSKKNSKYYWVLETITGKNNTSTEFDEDDFQMISSETGFIQNVKEEIIEKINAENVFNFDFEPKEGDYLSIKNNLRKKEYLNLIFMNNVWTEEIYMCSYRDCRRRCLLYHKNRSGSLSAKMKFIFKRKIIKLKQILKIPFYETFFEKSTTEKQSSTTKSNSTL
ncbi:hypothetical protein [Chryseobacterium indoltheticum]|uniref:hypothetical protein n=1 Tax=Chryseobacterium indoltheticum TaxID=254 RepID=UPI003F491AA9